ncbi:MAG: hypothetical protein IJ111_12095 [Eggerthellaceae bacterium]|nr:hypothetical protein [Eggerthellaceae bacterium]
MTDAEKRSWQLKRCALAIAIVAAVVSIAPISKAALGAVSAKPDAGSSFEPLRAQEVLAVGDPEAVLANIGRIAEEDAMALESAPDGFMEEIGLIAGARDLRMSGSVVGFAVDDSGADVLEMLCAHMEQRGWTGVPFGGAEGATFLKEGGRYSWALAVCTQVGDATSVVIQFA